MSDTSLPPPAAERVIQTKHGEIRMTSGGPMMQWRGWSKMSGQPCPGPKYPGSPDDPGTQWVKIDPGLAALFESFATKAANDGIAEQMRAAAERNARDELTRFGKLLKCSPAEVLSRVTRLHADARFSATVGEL